MKNTNFYVSMWLLLFLKITVPTISMSLQTTGIEPLVYASLKQGVVKSAAIKEQEVSKLTNFELV